MAHSHWHPGNWIEANILAESVGCVKDDDEESSCVTALRVQGPLCFANAQRIKDRLLECQVTTSPSTRRSSLQAVSVSHEC